ncbi:MAG: spore photoproduct lyase family protein [Salinispira sp.]
MRRGPGALMNSHVRLQSTYRFSCVYVEKAAQELPQTAEIIGKLQNNPRIITIEHYGDIFNRPRQRFTMQKTAPALILAVERKNFLYEGNERINSWTQSRLYYNALVRNCVYNCDYCFLQGMHSSAHILMFVNNDCFIDAARQRLAALQPPTGDQPKQLEQPKQPDQLKQPSGGAGMYLSISYLSDILAFEPLYPYCAEWIHFAAEYPQLGLEIRTKSDYYHAISHLKPVKNVFLVWSLSPEEVSSRSERGCASFRNRLFAAARAAADGWPIKLCFDPVLAVDGWQELYPRMIRETFARIPAELVQEVSFGVFRMSPQYFKRMQRLRPESPVINHGPRLYDGISTYPDRLIHDIRRTMEDELSKHMIDEKIFFVHG